MLLKAERIISLFKRICTKNKVIYLWIFFFAAVVSICLASIGIIYNKMQTSIENRLNETSLQSVNNIENALMEDIGSLYEYIHQLSINNRITKMLYSKDTTTPNYKLNIFYLTQDLFAFNVASDKSELIYIFNIGENNIISSNSTFSKYYFYNKYYSSRKVEYEKWNDAMLKYHYYDIVMLYDNVISEPIINIMHTLPVNGKEKVYSNIIVQFNSEEIHEYLSNSVVDSQMNFILSKDGEIMYRNFKDSPYDYKTILSSIEAVGQTQMKETKQGRFMIIQDSDNIMEWKFVQIVPYDEYVKEVSADKNSTIAIAVLSILFLFVLSGVVLKYNIHHLKNIIDVLNNNKTMKISQRASTQNEYTQIENRLMEIMKNRDFLEQEHKKSINIFKEKYLACLLYGQHKSDAIEFLTNEFGLRISKCKSTVLRVSYLNDAHYQKNNTNFEPLINDINSLLETLPESYWYYQTVVSDALIYIICKKANADLISSKKLDIDFGTVIKKKNVIMTMGRWHYGADMLDKSFLQAKEVFDYMRLMGNQNTFMSHEDLMKGFSVNDKGVSSIDFKPFYDAARSLDSSMAAEELDRLFEKMSSSSYQDPNIIWFHMNCIIYNFSCALYDNQVLGLNNVQQISDMKYRLLNCRNIDELKKEVVNSIKEAKGFYQQIEHALDIVQEINRYIDINLCDKELTVSIIAEHFHYSVSYISRAYKEKTGHGILDTINRRRIDAAIKLMKKKQFPVKEIAVRVGFTNTDSFIRVFKKYQYITPGNFMSLRIS